MTEQNLNLIDEVKRRRTFAIISHPDAGKTTLTENSYYTVEQYVKLVQLNQEDLKNMQFLTGWK